MPSRYYEKRERREPDKTPLIDVIFLLLIFFFVTLANLEVVPQRKAGKKPRGVKQKLELLALANPLEAAPDSLSGVVLLQIQPASDYDGSFIGKVNGVVQSLRNLNLEGWSVKDTLEVFVKPRTTIGPDDFLIFVLDKEFPDDRAIVTMVNSLEKRLTKGVPGLEEQSRIVNQSSFLPIKLPSWEMANQGDPESDDYTESADYINARRLLRAKLRTYFDNPQETEIHVRMHRTVYVKIIKDLFDICNERGINVENIKFRVIERPN